VIVPARAILQKGWKKDSVAAFVVVVAAAAAFAVVVVPVVKIEGWNDLIEKKQNLRKKIDEQTHRRAEADNQKR
jgi:hypothetical protein